MKKNLLFLIALLLTFSGYAQNPTGTTTAKQNGGWNNPDTWTNGVPASGDAVVIPAGRTVTIGIGTPDIDVFSITVRGSLTIGQALPAIDIKTRYIMIMGPTASFTWGTAAAPWEGDGTLTLMGTDSQDRIPGTGTPGAFSKGIMIMDGGKLDIHGKEKTSWTNIASNVGPTTANLNKVTLATDVIGWSNGDSVVLTSTDYLPTHAEKLKIQNIAGRVVTFDDNLQWKHFGQILNFNGSTKTFDQRAEIGLITRNITIKGQFITDPQNDGYGGYIMCMGDDNAMASPQARIENVNLFNMGQNGNKGSYPMHWHLCGLTTNQYIRNCSIRNSFNRGVVIHGTDGVTVGSNVLFQHRGHGFMLEDGDEENNVFNNNLGLGSVAPKVGLAIENSEMKVSTYWITNPNNTFTNNVAAGSNYSGFWLIPVSNVLRTSSPKNVPGYSPRAIKLKNFSDNTGHSCLNFNLGLEGNMSLATVQGEPLRTAYFDPLHPYYIQGSTTIPLEHVFTRFTSYKGKSNGVWTRGSVINRFEDCSIGEASFMAFLSYNAIVNNSLFAAITANNGSGAVGDEHNTNIPKILGLQMYNGSTDISNTHMAGFANELETSCIGNRQSSGKYPNFTATNITFEDGISVSNRVDFSKGLEVEDPARSYFFVAGMVDKDGSIIKDHPILRSSGLTTAAAAGEFANWRITPRIYKTNPAFTNRLYNPNFNIPPNPDDYKYFSDWSAYITRPTIKYGILHNWALWPANENEPAVESKSIYLIRSDGPATFDLLRKSTDAQIPILLIPGIQYFSQYHEMPNRMRSEFKWTTQNARTIAAFMNVPSNLTIDNSGETITKTTSLNDLVLLQNTGYFLEDNTLYVKYFATNVDNGLNSSSTTVDYSEADININYNPGDNNNAGYTQFVTLADFTTGVDARGSLSKSSTGIPAIQVGAITNDAGTNSFKITKGSNTNNYVDYNFTLTQKQIWKEFNKITFTYQGPPAQLMVRDDATTGSWITVKTIPNTNALKIYDIPLNDVPLASSVKGLDRVAQIKLRFLESAMVPTTQLTVKLDKITLSLNSPTANANTTVLTTNANEYLKTTQETGLLVYPNPANGLINIQLGEAITDLSIYDLSGKLVYSKKDTNGILSIPTSEIGKSGTYIIKTNKETSKLIINN